MRDLIDIVERYTSPNKHFLDYMRNPQFDPYRHWYWVCDWLMKNYKNEVQEMTGEQFQDAHEINDQLEPEFFSTLPEDVQRECAEHVTAYVMQHDPAEASTHEHMSLSKNNLLHRQTWLVHFSDNAQNISLGGFKYGVEDCSILGLTNHLGDSQKSYPGYNFAFEAGSRDAAWAASQGKYGRNAVLFQSAGVKCYHYGDEESQIVFYGPDVHQNSIIYLKSDGGDWQVHAKVDMKNRDYLFQGSYEDCVKWVVQNHVQYRKLLY